MDEYEILLDTEDEQDLEVESEEEQDLEVEIEDDEQDIEVEEETATWNMDYNSLINKPSINEVELKHNKSFEDLGAHVMTNFEIKEIFDRVFGGRTSHA